jgi:hypothetical protein
MNGISMNISTAVRILPTISTSPITNIQLNNCSKILMSFSFRFYYKCRVSIRSVVIFGGHVVILDLDVVKMSLHVVIVK